MSLREDIETVADLYQAYAIFNAPQDIIYVAIDGCWFGYNGHQGQIVGSMQISPYMGEPDDYGLVPAAGDALLLAGLAMNESSS